EHPYERVPLRLAEDECNEALRLEGLGYGHPPTPCLRRRVAWVAVRLRSGEDLAGDSARRAGSGVELVDRRQASLTLSTAAPRTRPARGGWRGGVGGRAWGCVAAHCA